MNELEANHDEIQLPSAADDHSPEALAEFAASLFNKRLKHSVYVIGTAVGSGRG